MTLHSTVTSRVTRLAAAGGLALIGGVLVTPNALTLVRGDTAFGMVIAGIGLLLGLIIAGSSVVIYRTDITTPHVARITGWNILGFVVLGAVLLLARVYLGTAVPLFVVATILSVSAFAHLIIGVNDVRRIRATALAREREKLTVVNRILRHNLSHDAQLLSGYVEFVENERAHERISEVAARLTELNEKARGMQELLERERPSSAQIDLTDAVIDLVADFEREYPDVTFELSVPDGVVVRGDDYLIESVTELVQNAVEHNDSDEPVVSVRVEQSRRDVIITVEDNGSGIPETERAIVDRSEPITQLSHSSGLGLWFTKWVAEAHGGDLTFDESSTVSLQFPRGSGRPTRSGPDPTAD